MLYPVNPVDLSILYPRLILRMGVCISVLFKLELERLETMDSIVSLDHKLKLKADQINSVHVHFTQPIIYLCESISDFFFKCHKTNNLAVFYCLLDKQKCF